MIPSGQVCHWDDWDDWDAPTSIFGIRHGGNDGGTRLGAKWTLAQLVGFIDEENAALGSLSHRGMSQCFLGPF